MFLLRCVLVSDELQIHYQMGRFWIDLQRVSTKTGANANLNILEDSLEIWIWRGRVSVHPKHDTLLP